jgi:hypothetical protein
MFDLHFPTRQPERPLDPPEGKLFSGDVVFAASLADETVEVFAKVEEDSIERESTEVRYQGINIAPVLCEQQWASLEKQFDEGYEQIVRFDRLDYWEE